MAAATGKAPRSSSAMPSGGTEPTPLWVTGIVDALASAQRQFNPENARAVVAVMDHYPTVLEAMGKFATAIGKRSVDAVDLPPSSQQLFLELGQLQTRSVGPARTALAAVRRSVADRIARYQAQRSQDAAWDVRANRQ